MAYFVEEKFIQDTQCPKLHSNAKIKPSKGNDTDLTFNQGMLETRGTCFNNTKYIKKRPIQLIHGQEGCLGKASKPPTH